MGGGINGWGFSDQGAIGEGLARKHWSKMKHFGSGR